MNVQLKCHHISKRMEQDLAYLKIRNFHKLNLLSRGQFATSKFLKNNFNQIKYINYFFSL